MCEELPPFGECGFGTCVNGSCVCDGGFSQNFEFYYKDLPPSGVITFCDYNSAAMTTVTSVLLLLTVFSFGIELIILKTWKQVKRLLPMLIGYVLLAMALVWRISQVDNSLYGYDVAYSLILTCAMFLLNLQQIIYLNKFVLYAVNIFKFKKSTRRMTQAVIQLQNVLLVLIFCGMMPLWATSVVESQVVSGQMLVAANIILICAHAGCIASGYILFTKYITDLQLVSSKDSGVAQRDTAFLEKCRKTIPRMRFVREALGVSNLWSVATNVLALALSGWLKLWVFLLYINFFAFQLSSLIVIQSSGRAQFRSREPVRRRTGQAPTKTGTSSLIQPHFESISKDVPVDAL